MFSQFGQNLSHPLIATIATINEVFDVVWEKNLETIFDRHYHELRERKTN